MKNSCLVLKCYGGRGGVWSVFVQKLAGQGSCNDRCPFMCNNDLASVTPQAALQYMETFLGKSSASETVILVQELMRVFVGLRYD